MMEYRHHHNYHQTTRRHDVYQRHAQMTYEAKRQAPDRHRPNPTRWIRQHDPTRWSHTPYNHYTSTTQQHYNQPRYRSSPTFQNHTHNSKPITFSNKNILAGSTSYKLRSAIKLIHHTLNTHHQSTSKLGNGFQRMVTKLQNFCRPAHPTQDIMNETQYLCTYWALHINATYSAHYMIELTALEHNLRDDKTSIHDMDQHRRETVNWYKYRFARKHSTEAISLFESLTKYITSNNKTSFSTYLTEHITRKPTNKKPQGRLQNIFKDHAKMLSSRNTATHSDHSPIISKPPPTDYVNFPDLTCSTKPPPHNHTPQKLAGQAKTTTPSPRNTFQKSHTITII